MEKMTNEQAIGTLATYVSLLGFDGSNVQEIVDQFATDEQKQEVNDHKKRHIAIGAEGG